MVGEERQSEGSTPRPARRLASFADSHRPGRTRAAGSRRPAAPGPGACSRITCALVPLIPNDDTAGPARPVHRRPRPRLGQQLDRAGGPVHLRRRGVHVQRRGQHPCRIAITILMTPATPAAAWVWPMFDLTDPSHTGFVAVLAVGRQQRLRLDRVAERVPVPCASTTSTSAAGQPGVGQRLPDHALLRRAVRGGQSRSTRRPG